MEEAATQEGRAKQLEEEIKEMRSKHKKELQDELVHRELLEKVTISVAFFLASLQLSKQNT